MTRRRRTPLAPNEMWCTWGKHRVRKHEYLKEQFQAGTPTKAMHNYRTHEGIKHV